MYLTQSNQLQLRSLTREQYQVLRDMCHWAKNMYNVALYNVRQFFFAERRHLCYESNYHYCKENENYKLLHSQVAQQTIKSVDEAISGFFKLLELQQSGKYHSQVRLPTYLGKGTYFPLVYPQMKVQDGKIALPVSQEFRREYKKRIGKTFQQIQVTVPPRLIGKKIRELRIIPKYDARFFYVQFVVETEFEPQSVDSEKALSLDLGLNNLASCIDTDGASFIVDGRKLKSINRWFNEEISRLQSIKDRQGIKRLTNTQASLWVKRTNQIKDYMNKAARIIVNHCLKKQIGKLIVGVNPGMRQKAHVGYRNNQQFVQIPYYHLREKLQQLCQKYGINYIEQEESYTSKSSFLDNDPLPAWNADNPQEYEFSGKRNKRGLYVSKSGKVVNADIQGAANILRKCIDRLSTKVFERVSIGLLANPLRVKIS